MTTETLNTHTYYEFKVPSLTKDKKEIPPNIRMEVFNHIVGRCIMWNGGADVISGIGYYLSKENKVMQERIDIVRTQGVNPFDAEDFKYFTKILEQECIMIDVCTGYTSSFVSLNSIEEAGIEERKSNEDGTYTQKIEITNEFSDKKEFIEVDTDNFGYPFGHKYTKEEIKLIGDELDVIYEQSGIK